MKCIVCSHTINYNYQIEGREFVDKNLPGSFRNMRTSIILHLESENRQKIYCLLKKMRNEVMRKGKDCGINCADTTLCFYKSAKSYEHHIADVCNLVAKIIMHGFLICSCPIYMMLFDQILKNL